MNRPEVNPSVTGQCPQCGAGLPAGALGGLCPACLLKEGAAADTGTQPGIPPFEPPPVAELARLFPQLEIVALLGKGGMGAVYKARQPALDRFVALKILPARSGADSGFAERFNREARALARLSHPNIVGVHEFGRVDGLHFFLMEYVDGVNLRQLQKSGRLSPREALQIVPQICDALQYAHDEGVVHRDIKPENVLVDRRGRVKIADFGLAKILGVEAPDLRLTGEGQVMGTPHYMAPEQVEHPLEVDHRADIFSLGVVFYELLTGELPLGKFAPPSRKVQVDVRLDEVVLHALEKEPQRRYQQANEVKTAVQQIASGPSAGLAPGSATRVMVSVPRWAMGMEYRSKATLWGLPLLHVATGMDPQTGKRRVATGIVAIGNVARGIIAFGGVALGGIACGGLAVGGVAFGGLGLGLLALGGMAIGMVAALGGGAAAPIAVGGGAVGYWAYGGGAWGAHAMSGIDIDPRAWDFFQPWVEPLMRYVFAGGMGLAAGVILLTILLPAWLQRRDREAVRRPGFWGQVALGLFCAGFCVVPLLFASTRLELPRLYLVTGRVTRVQSGEPLPNTGVTLSLAPNAQQVPPNSLLKYPPGEGTGPTGHGDGRAEPVGGVPSRGVLGMVQQAAKELAQGRSDANGRFLLVAPAAGDRIVAWREGYEAHMVPLSADLFGRKRHAHVDIQLLPNPFVSWSWIPEVAPGQQPDPNKIRDEANELRDQGQYEAALKRYVWYWRNALKYDPGLAVGRLSFLLANWVELGRRFPEAKQALLDIRTRDTQLFLDGRGSFELFQEVASLNQSLQDEQATYALFKRIQQQDPALARQCFFVAKPLLVQHGDYALCLEYLGDPQTAFSWIRKNWEVLKQSEQRGKETAQRIAGAVVGVRPPAQTLTADRRFIDETCQLILILVKTGHKTEAEQIRDQALALLEDPRLKSAVADAEPPTQQQ